MKKGVIASIRPEWNYLIFTNQKGVEVRKTRPLIPAPFRVLVYSTMPKSGVPGLCIENWKGEVTLGKVFPCNYDAARKMGMTLLDGKVIGEFTCDRITEFKVFEDGSVQNWNFADLDRSCLAYEQLAAYIGFGKTGYAWHISDPILYSVPKDLADFGIKRAPQSWQYINL